MNVEGSKEVLIKTYEYDPQILYLCKKKKKKTKQNQEAITMSKHCEI